MSDTPKTDYLEQQLSNAAHPSAMRFCRELERENAELRKDKQRLNWLLGDCGSRYVEKDMALGTWDASEVFETREDIDRVMAKEGESVLQRENAELNYLHRDGSSSKFV
jgi:hypothetical protein